MQDDIDTDNTKALLQSAQQLRIHWSGFIPAFTGYTIIITIGIWSFFLKSYVDNISNQFGSIYILLASALSALVLGFWRFYAHHLDHHIAGLYPELLYYEGKLSIPAEYGTMGYLIREKIPFLENILSDKNLTLEQKSQGIKELVERKRIGNRGQKFHDYPILLILFIFFIINIFILISDLGSYKITGAVITIIGFIMGGIFLYKAMWCFQRDPSKTDIKCVRLSVISHQ